MENTDEGVHVYAVPLQLRAYDAALLRGKG